MMMVLYITMIRFYNHDFIYNHGFTDLALHKKRHDDLVSVVLRCEDQRRRFVSKLSVITESITEERLVRVLPANKTMVLT